jgi:hypothetical protein
MLLYTVDGFDALYALKMMFAVYPFLVCSETKYNAELTCQQGCLNDINTPVIAGEHAIVVVNFALLLYIKTFYLLTHTV